MPPPPEREDGPRAPGQLEFLAEEVRPQPEPREDFCRGARHRRDVLRVRGAA